MLSYDIAQLKRPIQGRLESTLCGDETLVIDNQENVFLALFDGAGHGFSAYKVSQSVMFFIKKYYEKPMSELLMMLHEHLKGTVGGVIGICRINKITGQAKYVGIGNIASKIIPGNRRLSCRGGILGFEITNPIVNEFELKQKEALVIYSDGVTDHFDIKDVCDISLCSASEISNTIIDNYSKKSDDASVIVIKVKND